MCQLHHIAHTARSVSLNGQWGLPTTFDEDAVIEAEKETCYISQDEFLPRVACQVASVSMLAGELLRKVAIW